MKSHFERPELLRIWTEMPSEVKLSYRDRCRKILNESEERLIAFLKKFGLTLSEFKRIEKVTKEYQSLLAKRKQ